MADKKNTKQKGKTMIILNCTNCGEDFECYSRYDEDMEDPVSCSHCGWTASKFTFDYVREEGEDNG